MSMTYSVRLPNGEVVTKRSATRSYPFAIVSHIPAEARPDGHETYFASFASTRERADREARVLVTPGIQRWVVDTEAGGEEPVSAPLTSWSYGSIRCVMCGARFVDTPGRTVVEREAIDFAGARPGYSPPRPVQVRRRWHEECLAEYERANAAYRDQIEADRLQGPLRAVRRATGRRRPALEG